VGVAAGKLVEVAVGCAEVQPLPVAVSFEGADDLDRGCGERCVCGVDVVHLEQRDRAAALSAEEVEVGVAGANTWTRSPLGSDSSIVVGSSNSTVRPMTSRRR
jgi:hypothetical protein